MDTFSLVRQGLLFALTRNGYLIEEQGMTYLTDIDAEAALHLCKRRPAPAALHSGHGRARKP
ncbi:MAG: hypothetical protein ACREXX_19460 [Gammaproteobacteria bacterium]